MCVWLFDVCDVYVCDVYVRVYGGEEGACPCVCVLICDNLGCILIIFIVLCQEHRKGGVGVGVGVGVDVFACVCECVTL